VNVKEFAVMVYGSNANDSRSKGQRKIRVIARRLFPASAP
jgi:hypothetical protein